MNPNKSEIDTFVILLYSRGFTSIIKDIFFSGKTISLEVDVRKSLKIRPSVFNFVSTQIYGDKPTSIPHNFHIFNIP